jgi:hypothetical protein
MLKIKHNLKVSQDRKKRYADKGITQKEFKVGDHVFLKLKAKKSSMKLGNYSKLAARYCGPFEILERIGPIDYMLSFLASMSKHNVFYVSLLNKYILYANHIIDCNVIWVEQGSSLQVHLIRIMD